MKLDIYLSTGFALELLSKSPYHKQFNISEYLCVEVLPAFQEGQAKFYITDDGIPTAMVTWAWLSNDTEKDILSTGRALTQQEWKCGDRLFFNDWLSPYGSIRQYVKDMTQNVFPNHTASSLRRNQDGSIRKVNRWMGKNKKFLIIHNK